MITIELKDWCRKLIECGDFSEKHSDEVSQKRIERYWELIDMVDGSEGQEVFNAILSSIQDEGMTEAYESTYNALWKFPPMKFAEYFIEALPTFLDRNPEEAGRFLLGLIGWAVDEYLPHFNDKLATIPVDAQSKIMEFVKREENGGWFDSGKGLIKPLRIA